MKIKNIMIAGLMLAATGAFADTTVQTNNNVNVQTTANVTDKTQDAFSNVYEKTKHSVVNIRTKKTIIVNTYNPLEEFLFGTSGRRQEKRESGSLGSGFVISSDGYVMTNNHVIDGSDEIFVKFGDGEEYSAKLVGSYFLL